MGSRASRYGGCTRRLHATDTLMGGVVAVRGTISHRLTEKMSDGGGSFGDAGDLRDFASDIASDIGDFDGDGNRRGRRPQEVKCKPGCVLYVM